MAIAQSFKEDLVNLINGGYPSVNNSNVLESPSFTGKGSTTFKQDVVDNTNIKLADVTLDDVIGYKNKIIVLSHDTKKDDSVISIYDDRFNLIHVLDKESTNVPAGTLLPRIYNLKVTRNGLLYGISKGIKGDPNEDKVCFFMLNDFLDTMIFLDDASLLDQTYFITMFTLEDKVNNPQGEWVSGSEKFKLILDDSNRFDISQDYLEEFKFSTVIWDSTTNELIFIQFTTDLGQRDPSEADWLYNEVINLTQGGVGASTFEGISELGILTGNSNIIKDVTSIGSIAFSTQKDAAGGVNVPFQATLYSGDNYDYSRSYQMSWGSGTSQQGPVYRGVQPLRITRPGFFENIIDKYNGVLTKSPNAKIDNLQLDFESGVNDDILTFNMSDALFNTIRDIYKDGREAWFEINYNRDRWTLSLEATVKDPQGNLVKTQIQQIGVYTWNQFFTQQQRGRQNQVGPRTFTATDHISIHTYVNISLTVSGSRNQQTVTKNTTSQVLIEENQTNDTLEFKITQTENNSYEGTKPVFINPQKFYIPLKDRITNTYDLYEFTGTEDSVQQAVTRFYNDVGDKDYVGGTDIYTQTLISPTSITDVSKNGVPGQQYTLNGDEITIPNIKTNDVIIITYESVQGTPTKIELSNSSIPAERVNIIGVNDYSELGTTTTAVVGVGDNFFNGNQTEVYGFNFYKDAPNIDFNKLAINEQQEDSITMNHPLVFRQKNVLYFFGFNEDYTEYYSWLQIYPDSFEPYTYLPYDDANKRFVMRRLNVNKDLDPSTTRFDREFIDVTSSGQLVLAQTTAATSDLNNQDNNKVVVYGQTNKPIFEIDQTILKTEEQNMQINVRLETGFVDNLMGTEVVRPIISQSFKDLLTKGNQDLSHISFGDSYVLLDSFQKIPFDASIFTTANNDKLTFAISLYNKDAGENFDHKPVAMVINNKYGEKLFEIDLTENQCDGHVTNISFDIVISDNKGGQ